MSPLLKKVCALIEVGKPLHSVAFQVIDDASFTIKPLFSRIGYICQPYFEGTLTGHFGILPSEH